MMSTLHLLHPGALEPLHAARQGRGLFRVVLPVRFLVGGVLMSVPAGFLTDGASIPWWCRWLFDTWGRVAHAAILHDWLLSAGDRPKWECDWLFLGALRAAGVGEAQASIMYLAVRSRSRLRRAPSGAARLAWARLRDHAAALIGLTPQGAGFLSDGRRAERSAG